MADKSTRTKMLEETEIEDDTLGLKKALRAGAIGASKLADKLGFTQEKEYKGKTKEEIQMKNGLKDVDAEENPGLSKLPTWSKCKGKQFSLAKSSEHDILKWHSKQHIDFLQLPRSFRFGCKCGGSRKDSRRYYLFRVKLRA